MPLLKSFTRNELYTLANLAFAEADSRIEGELLQLLRKACAPGPGEAEPPVVSVEFVTDANYDDGMYWSDSEVYFHRADGSVVELDFIEDAEENEEFRDLLADYSRLDRPVHGAHLSVDPATGIFTVTGPNSLA